jgi:aryl-alcohol dehydrogenase-like predicted oxidoreductase
MEMRKIGRSDLMVSPIAFGGNVFGWSVNETLGFQLLDAWVNAGLNFIDTADMYSTWVPGNKGGESETIIGNWLKKSGKRDQVVIATKVGMNMGEGKSGLSKKYILEAVEDSLRRLQTDYIDLYQSHCDDANTPLEETLEAYAQLLKEGKIRAIGASNYSAQRLKEALTISQNKNLPRYECLQPLYNLYDRAQYEQEFEPVCEEYNLGVISYFSLASGFLSGKYRSEKDLAKSAARGGAVKKYLNDRGFKILHALEEVAKRNNTTSTQVALSWIIQRPSVTAPIVSATNIEQLNDLVTATKLRLNEMDIAQLDEASQY